jgi:hypothetical protein
MTSKWLSRKLLLTIVVDLLAMFTAFGGAITPEQSGAIIGLVTSVYMIANAYEGRSK